MLISTTPTSTHDVAAPQAATLRPLLFAVGGACALHLLLLWTAAPGRYYKPLALPTPGPRLQWRWVPLETTRPVPTAQAPSSREHAGPAPAPPTHRPRNQATRSTEVLRPSELNPSGVGVTDAGISPSADAVIQSPAPPTDPVQPPLQLQLPASPWRGAAPHSARNQALNDGRSNTRSASLEERIAQATTGNDGLSIDPLGEGRARVRMNGRCVEVQQARIAQIDPMSEVSRRAAAGQKACSR